MRIVPIISVILALSSLNLAVAQPRTAPKAGLLRAFPTGAEAREAKLLARMGPQTRAYIAREARREAQNGNVSEVEARASAQAYGPSLGALDSGDVEALAFLVLMQASRDAQSDLGDIMAATKGINNSKAKLRAESVGGGRPSLPGALQPPGPPVAPKTETLADVGESQQLHMQTMTDQRAKLLETLSNIMKKSSDTQDSIVHNMK